MEDGSMKHSLALPDTGYLRLPQVLAIIPVSKSTWWAGVRSGRYPQPTRALGERITAWAASDIRELIERAAPKAVA
jgi:predicted DNA-binding transcriptional regulator AlpA